MRGIIVVFVEYVCANFNIRLVTNNAGVTEIINVGDKMLAQPSLAQFHSTESVSLARAEHNKAYHFGNIGHELVVSRYFGPYTDLWSAANNAFAEAASKDNISQQGVLTIDFSTSTGEIFEIRNAAMSEMNILRGEQYGKGFVVEYRYIFGELDDITTAKLLDNYGTGAEAAYSLRELSTAWAGLAVVEVREDGGDTTQTFTEAELTDGTLATFCGINNGFVTEWKDQSGNANDATQATLADQPKIYDSITGLVTQDSLPAIDFDGAGDRLQMDSSVTGINNIAAVARADDAAWNYLIGQGVADDEFKGLITRSTGDWPYLAVTNNFYFYNDGFISLDGVSLTANKTAQNNQIIFAGSSDDGGAFNLRVIGGDLTDRYWDGTIQEIILWSTKQQTNPGIIDEMNRYYQLY